MVSFRGNSLRLPYTQGHHHVISNLGHYLALGRLANVCALRAAQTGDRRNGGPKGRVTVLGDVLLQCQGRM